MRKTKRIFTLLLAVLFILPSIVTCFAVATPQVATAKAGETVTLTFRYDDIAGIRGSFKVYGDDIVSKLEFVPSTGFQGNYSENNRIMAYFAGKPADFVCELKVTLKSTAVPGNSCEIEFEYETTTDGKLGATPLYQYEFVTIKVAVNYDELNRQIAIAQGLNQADYTAQSWAVLADALAKAIAARTSNSQAVVDQAAKTLADAIAALQPVPGVVVDYTELNRQIAIAQGLNHADYTAQSWAVLANALAKAIAAKTSDSQAVVDQAAKTLADAIAALVPVPVVVVDYTELNRQIAIAQGLNQADYTAQSWAVLANALAKAIAARTSDSQAVVDQAAKTLADAIAALQPVPGVVVDYTELNRQIAIAQGLNQADYTAQSWAVLADALTKAIAARTSDSQAVVDQAAKTLADAIAALVPVPGVVVDYTVLNRQIAIAQGLNQADYTAQSWAVLADALTKAIAATASDSQAVVDQAAKTLADAIAALVPVPGVVVDYTELNRQISIAQGLKQEDYTVESWAVLVDALAKAIAAKTSDSQAVVDQAAKTLADAIAALVPVPGVVVDYTELNRQISIAQGLKQEDYTVESWAVLADALAKAIAAKTSDSQAVVDQAAKTLADAIAALEHIPGVVVDYTELNRQIAIAQGLKEADYTSESWAVLADALAKAIAAKTSDSQAVVDQAAKTLADAIAALERATVDVPVDTPVTGDDSFVFLFLALALTSSMVLFYIAFSKNSRAAKR